MKEKNLNKNLQNNFGIFSLSVIRGWIARKRIFFKLRSKLKLLSMRYRAVITIQKYAKRQICQRFFNNQRIAVVCMQSGNIILLFDSITVMSFNSL